MSMVPQKRSIPVDGLDRQYVLYCASITTPLPLLIFLHGAGGSAAWAEWETGLSSLLSQREIALVYPEGLAIHPEKPSKFLTNPQVWNDGSPRGSSAKREVDDVRFLDALIDDLLASFPIHPKQIVLSGFSNGAGMTFRYAAERSERLAGIVPVAGYCWHADPHCTQPIPTLYMLGLQDPLIPMHGGRIRTPWGSHEDRPTVPDTLNRWANAIGCSQKHLETTSDNGIHTWTFPGPVSFQALFVPGLGHHWPNGKGGMGERLGGPMSDLVDGNQNLLQFMEQLVTEE